MGVNIINHPPMGWNSWDCFGGSVNEEQLLANARYMRDNLKDYGWEYVVCDIQWSEPGSTGHYYRNFTELCMDEYSRLIPAENRFPSSAEGKGFKPIADEIHKMGLKFGIHIMRGIPRQAVHRNTPIMCEGVTARDIAHPFSLCSWNTDMYGLDPNKKGAQEYYDSIMQLYADWGVDFIKCDDIANTEFKPHDPYFAAPEIEMLRKAIDKTGRKIVLSLSPGPAPIFAVEHLARNAQMWRMSGDFWDKWDRILEMFDLCRDWAPYVTDGAYPDCDMLPVGMLEKCNGNPKGRWTRFTENEQITMLTLWSIFRSPLMIGGNMPENDDFTLKLLTNRDIIEMNKNSRGAKETFRDESRIIWTAEGKNCKYICIFNLEDEEKNITVGKDITGNCEWAKEMWSGESVTDFDFRIGAHSAVALKTGE